MNLRPRLLPLVAALALLCASPACSSDEQPEFIIAVPLSGPLRTIRIEGVGQAVRIDSVNLCGMLRGQWFVSRNGKAYGTFPASEYAVIVEGETK